MIGPFHLLLMLWLGGAVCFASFMHLFARHAPEEFGETGLTLPAMVIATLVWPFALIRAAQMVQQEMQWKERRRVRFPPASSPGSQPNVLVIGDEIEVPELCAPCAREREQMNQKISDVIKTTPAPCDECQQRFANWTKQQQNAVR